MKKIIALALFFWSVAALAQNSLLFEITGNDLDKPSYLFGTMHVQDEAAFGWNDSVFWAINQAQVSAFELDFDAKKMKNKFKASKSQQKEWEEFLMKDLSPAIEKIISADTLGLRISGFYTEVLKTLLEKDKNKNGTFVDKFLQEYAGKNGKEIVGIESIQEQLNIVLDMDKQLLKTSIIDFLEADNWDIDVDMMTGQKSGMIEAYSTRRLSEVCKVLDDITAGSSNELVNELYGRVFEDRNKIMFKRVSKMIKGKSHFVAVGSGHLCGNTGLVQELQAAGYSVRPIDILTASDQATAWQTFETENYTVQVPEGVNGIDPSTNEYAEYINGNPHATLYTTKGKATFSIALVNDMYYEDASDYGYDEVESVEEYEMDASEEAYHDATEAVEAATDSEMEEMEYEEIEYDEQPEIVEEYEDVEVEVATNSYEEMEYDEQPEVEEEYEDDGDDYDTNYGGESKKTKKRKNPLESEYWSTVTKTVVSNAMGQMMAEAFKDAGKEKESDEPSVQQVVIMGNNEKIVSETSYSGYAKTMTIKTDNGSYELKITGDAPLLDSGALDAFFNTFQLK